MVDSAQCSQQAAAEIILHLLKKTLWTFSFRYYNPKKGRILTFGIYHGTGGNPGCSTGAMRPRCPTRENFGWYSGDYDELVHIAHRWNVKPRARKWKHVWRHAGGEITHRCALRVCLAPERDDAKLWQGFRSATTQSRPRHAEFNYHLKQHISSLIWMLRWLEIVRFSSRVPCRRTIIPRRRTPTVMSVPAKIPSASETTWSWIGSTGCRFPRATTSCWRRGRPCPCGRSGASSRMPWSTTSWWSCVGRRGLGGAHR